MSTITFSTVQPFDDQLDPKEFILIKGAKANNLKGVDVAIPRNQLVVVTGLSGSGKSSLAFDTLFAEGQRMYVESLSSYARQFLGRMQKPEVDYIRGVSPAIAIEQKVSTRNIRSTVGTTTEIYDYLKLLYARIGKTYSPISGEEVKKDTPSEVVQWLAQLPAKSRVLIMAKLIQFQERTLGMELGVLQAKGYSRVYVDGEVKQIDELLESQTEEAPKKGKKAAAAEFPEAYVLIDRWVKPETELEEDDLYRLSDSIATAFEEGHGECHVLLMPEEWVVFNDRFERDGIVFEEPSVNLFTFNNPYGACKRCEGTGKILGIDHDLVIPDPTLSVYEGAVAPWRGDTFREVYLQPVLKKGLDAGFPIHRPYEDLTDTEKAMLWDGVKGKWEGLHQFFELLSSQTQKIQSRVMVSRFRGRMTCPDCKGTRLRKDAQYVQVGGKNIAELVLMQVVDLAAFFKQLALNAYEQKVTKQIVEEVNNRLSYMLDVGLGYLTLNRLTSTLSGGEFQRIQLATSLGSALVGSMYILDEPSIGLHPRDTDRLIKVLTKLRDLGNTVIVVEHEEEVMRAADQIIDIGPQAGAGGGELVWQASLLNTGPKNKSKVVPDSHTFRFLTGIDKIPVPERRRPWKDAIAVVGARENNLRNLTVKFPLGVLTVVTGVSGSGKSTLVRNILAPALGRELGVFGAEMGRFDKLEGAVKLVQALEVVDQNPIGKSSRSNPVTYIKAWDLVRDLFADQQLSKARGYKSGFFSFNVDGGRCDECQGEGYITVEMQFMADLKMTCEVCKGKRFKSDLLEVTYKGQSVADILDMTVEQAIEFFKEKHRIAEKLSPLQKVGLGYVKLGQSSSTLSGGESQRVKLATYLGKGNDAAKGMFFIFDEPTTGLHFHDIHQLLKALQALVEQGNTVLIVEHNMEVIKSADWIIDLGPEGGSGGGKLVFEGTPEDMVKNGNGYTADFLKKHM